MKLLRRLLERLDSTLVTDQGNSIPAQRTASPDEIVRGHLPKRFRESGGCICGCDAS